MDPKDIFERRARRGVGPMQPAPPPGALDSVTESIFERLPVPISDPLPRQIEFRRKTGSWFSFPYHCLMEIEYHPHDCIALIFTTQRVELKGRNLEALYKALREQRCETIEEMDRATALSASEDAPEVREIRIGELQAGPPTAHAPPGV